MLPAGQTLHCTTWCNWVLVAKLTLSPTTQPEPFFTTVSVNFFKVTGRWTWVSSFIASACTKCHSVDSPNNGHIGTSHFDTTYEILSVLFYQRFHLHCTYTLFPSCLFSGIFFPEELGHLVPSFLSCVEDLFSGLHLFITASFQT